MLLKNENHLNAPVEANLANHLVPTQSHQALADGEEAAAAAIDPNDTAQPDSVRLLTVHEVGERLQVPSGWVYRHTRELGGIKLGKYTRFSWPQVIECLGKLGR
jgi:hypothetical protein